MTFRIVLEADTMAELDLLIARLASSGSSPGRSRRKALPADAAQRRPVEATLRKYTPDQILAAVRDAKHRGVREASLASGMSTSTLYNVLTGKLYKDLWPEVQKIRAAPTEISA